MLTVIGKAMNSASNVLSHQGTTPSPKKSEGMDSAEKPSEGAIGGHSVSSVADGDTLAIVSAGQQDAGITEESAECPLLRRDAAQRAPSGVALTMSVDRTASVQQQLQRELEIVSDLISGLSVSGNQMQARTMRQEMSSVIREVLKSILYSLTYAACDLKKAGGLRDVAYIDAATLKKCEEVEKANRDFLVAFDYIKKSGDIDMARYACKCRALIQFLNHDEVNALRYFQKEREFGYPSEANHSDSFLIQRLALGIEEEGRPSVEDRNDLFQPEFFYDELQGWALADEPREPEDMSLRDKRYYNGAKLLFRERGLRAVEKCDRYISRFIKVNESEPESERPSDSTYYMLQFARNLKLINEGYLDEALKNVERAEKSGKSEESEESEEYKFKYLDEYIRFLVLKKTGKTDQAIEVCKQGVAKGYPFSKYLPDLVRVRKKPVYV